MVTVQSISRLALPIMPFSLTDVMMIKNQTAFHKLHTHKSFSWIITDQRLHTDRVQIKSWY